MEQESSLGEAFKISFVIDDLGQLKTKVESNLLNENEDYIILKIAESLELICSDEISYNIISAVASSGYDSPEKSIVYNKILSIWQELQKEKESKPCISPRETLQNGHKTRK